MKKRSSKPMKIRLRKGDLVRVIAGDDRGAEGRILLVDRERGRAIVEGVNFVTRHLRKSPDHPRGRVIQVESPIHVSNLVRVDERPSPPSEKKSESTG